jgi:UDP-N-acetylmuramoyl-L-alanyl-D-glutamate--2,6-diaminopimelate ligase
MKVIMKSEKNSGMTMTEPNQKWLLSDLINGLVDDAGVSCEAIGESLTNKQTQCSSYPGSAKQRTGYLSATNTGKEFDAKWILGSNPPDLPKDDESQSFADPLVITSITCDSRKVRQGALFVAIPGTAVDGARFIPQAIADGASAVICEEGLVLDPAIIGNATILHAKQPRRVLSEIAARCYTPQPEHIVAVTGTNGKTSTAHFCKEIWSQLGVESASIGTIGISDTKGLFEENGRGSLTTPDPVVLHQNLQRLALGGVNHVAMEASSHGLDQYRLHGVNVQAAAFTSFSRDHLDYHKTEEAYLQAKMILFTEILPEGSVAVIHRDCQVFDTVRRLCEEHKHRIITYGVREGADIHIRSTMREGLGQQVEFSYDGRDYQARVPLIGGFQIENLMAAFGLVVASGADADKVASALPKVSSVRGRMQIVDASAKKGVVVDYAHTPDALAKALQELRPYVAEGKSLWVVFGCGGDRDKGKRPQMGEIAASLADKVIVTDDNPRTEEAAAVRQDILAACEGAVEIEGRKKAIAYAIDEMAAGDMLLIAGKGHETYQIIGTTYHDFDDVAVAEECLDR